MTSHFNKILNLLNVMFPHEGDIEVDNNLVTKTLKYAGEIRHIQADIARNVLTEFNSDWDALNIWDLELALGPN